ncbi:MAG TPA: hypothetical protein VNU84_05215 [Candidatus Acidoferrum sp.]|nr:hypothetical protein [Candidatus Acidoferrum sp.]
MIPAECPVCHKKPACAGSTVYCPSCGWNRDSAISALKMSMNSFPIGVLMFVGMAAFVYWGMKFKNSPQLMLFFAFPALILPWQYFSIRRKLAELRALAVAPQAAGMSAGFGAVPCSAPAAPATFPVKAADQALLRAPVPRRIRMSKGGRISLGVAAFACCVFLVPMCVHLYSILASPNSFASFQRDDWILVVIAPLLLLVPYGLWRSQVRECDLLENGEVVMGRVTRQWTDKGNSSIEYEFADFTGQQHRGMCNDNTKQLFTDMPVAVFYDRDKPKRQIAACSTFHEVVIP